MANSKKAEFEVKIHDRDYVFRFGNNEICEIEAMCNGMKINSILEQIDSFSIVRNIVYVGLKKTMRKLTRSEVGDMLDGMDLKQRTDLSTCLANGITLACYGKTLDDIAEDQTESEEGKEGDKEDPLL